MLGRILTYTKWGSRFYGVELCTLDESDRAFVVEVRSIGDELKMVMAQGPLSLDELLAMLQPSIPVVLVPNTLEVLNKHTRTRPSDLEKMVFGLLPNFDTQKLVYQVYEIGGQVMVSFAKKTEVQELVQRFKDNGSPVLQLYLGISAVSELIGDLPEEDIKGNRFRIQNKVDGPLVELISNQIGGNFWYTIHDLKVAGKHLQCLGAVVTFLQGENLFKLDTVKDQIQLQAQEFGQGRIFRTAWRSLIFILLGILLINGLAYLFYRHQFNRMDSEKYQLGQKVSQIELLEATVREKELSLSKMQTRKTPKLSFYLDRLAGTVPVTVQMTELIYQPKMGGDLYSGLSDLDKNKLVVKVSAIQPAVLFQWLERLRQLDWIESVEVKYLNRDTSALYVMEFNLIVSDGL